jgi:predicted transport protein
MSDIRLFRLSGGEVCELEGQSIAVEKSLQRLIEQHLEIFLGIRFLASEYSTGKVHRGRIDTLGIDENGSPVIIEYKRALNENVINQGLFYLDWLMDHEGDFELLVRDRYGQEAAEMIEWTSPRLLCIAGGFTRYDEHAVLQMNRNIELIQYRRYGDDFLLFELVNAGQAEVGAEESDIKTSSHHKTPRQYYEQSTEDLQDLFESLSAFLQALGDDVQTRWLKYYVAFSRIKNFATVVIRPDAGKLLVYLPLDPSDIEFDKDLMRDVSNIGHHGTGELEITIKSEEDLEQVKPLLIRSYESS